jgi:hypothetical protein
MQLLGREAFREAHTCPNCGTEVREKYFHDEQEQKGSNDASCALLFAAFVADFLDGKSIEFSEL